MTGENSDRQPFDPVATAEKLPKPVGNRLSEAWAETKILFLNHVTGPLFEIR